MRNIFLFFIASILISSCSSTKIDSNRWTTDSYSPKNQTRILIIANTDNKELQKAFEDKMARAILRKGFNSLKMNELLPQIPYKKERSDEEIEQIVTLFKEKGIKTVLLASKKSVETKMVASKSSFKNYLNSLQPLRTEGSVQSNLDYEMEELVVYTLEAVVYDLSLTQGNRALATATVQAVNPNSEEDVKKEFLRQIVQLFTEE